MKRLTTILLFSFFIINAHAQRLAIGARATPDGAGFNAKAFIKNDLVLEGQVNVGGILGLEGESFSAVGLLEKNIALPNPQWRLYFGGGIHVGTWNRKTWYRALDNTYITGRSEPIFGLDGIAGVEYLFKNIPLGVSADFKPAVNIISSFNFFPHNMVGVSARYYLK